MPSDAIRFVRRPGDGTFSVPMIGRRGGSERVIQHLLWGDRVTVLDEQGTRARVAARGLTGEIDRSALGNQPLLELYVIDVGQGDAVFIRSPDGRHLLVDGGYHRAKQPAGKSAADFVDWKFVKDYGERVIRLDAMIASHCDADHYGGLWDLLLQDEHADETDELDADSVQVDAFYHAGIGWWTSPQGTRTLGPVEDGLLTLLLEDAHDLTVTLHSGKRGHKLQGEWARFLRRVSAHVPVVQRLHAGAGYLPGFAPQAGTPAIKILAPIERTTSSGQPGLPSFGSPSKNTNGNSLVLRIDYGKARIMVTGDLNTASQHALLDYWAGHEDEFACDVAKACHHGSDDVSLRFLEALQPAVTIFSSGDNETHDHPRPSIVGAIGATGFRSADAAGDRLATPLVYSTELARSINIGKLDEMDVVVGGNTVSYARGTFSGIVRYLVTAAGALRPARRKRALQGCYVVGGIVYGLVNVRTDGDTIMCATRNEGDFSWKTNAFRARF